MYIKKFFLIGFAVFFFPLIVLGANIQEYCFIDNYGDYWRFIGGKLGKKAFATEVVNPICGMTVGVATFPKESGKYLMTAVIGRDTPAVCVPAEIFAAFTSDMLQGEGVYDNFPREVSPDGSLGFTAIDCSTFPLSVDKHIGLKPKGHGPGIQSE